VIEVEEPKRSVTGGTESKYEITVKNLDDRDDDFNVIKKVHLTAMLGEDAPEWKVRLVEMTSAGAKVLGDEGEITIPAKGSRKLVLWVETPHGVKYGDRAEVIITTTSKADAVKTDTLTITTTARQTIMAVKTSIGHERAAADSVYGRAKRKDFGIFAMLCPAKLRGYVLVEAMNVDRLKEVVRGVRKARGVVEGETTFEEINHYLTPKPIVSGIMEGDIVELIAGPFKGEKARVQQIDESKEEITVELFESMVPIPVTIRGDSVRVLEKDKGVSS